MIQYDKFIDVNSTPQGAENIGVYDEDNNIVGIIEMGEGKSVYDEDVLYTFGVISDVHNKEDLSDLNTDDFINAINYFDTNKVDFIVICGDLTLNSYQSEDYRDTEMAIYLQNRKTTKTLILPTTGNHDCYTTEYGYLDIETFLKMSGVINSIQKPTDSRITYDGYGNVYEFTPISGEHFLFLCMNTWALDVNGFPYLEEDITWLALKLEDYKNDRCYIITHLFFPSKSGNINRLYSSGNWLGGKLYSDLISLYNKYTNTYWFSGHSHWKWNLQEMQDNANIYPTTNENRNSGWAIHIPSCAYPNNTTDGETRFYETLESEGAIVKVYADYIDINGVYFKHNDSDEYTNKSYPIALYRLPKLCEYNSAKDNNLVHLSSILKRTDKIEPLSITETLDGTDVVITIQFTLPSSGIGIAPIELSNEKYTNWECDSISITNIDGENLTDYLNIFRNSVGKIPCGFYQGRDNYEYSVYNNGYVTRSKITNLTESGVYGLLLNISSAWNNDAALELFGSNVMELSEERPITITIKNLRIYQF